MIPPLLGYARRARGPAELRDHAAKVT
jgi:hypothetical protein